MYRIDRFDRTSFGSVRNGASQAGVDSVEVVDCDVVAAASAGGTGLVAINEVGGSVCVGS